MNLRPVNPPDPALSLLCDRCGKWLPSTELLSDLDGEPFKYLCHPCAAKAENIEQLGYSNIPCTPGCPACRG